jgi:hypothetical protein
MAPMKCFVLAGWFAVAAIFAPTSWAQSNSPALASVPSGPASKPSAPKVAKPYFVEFRARSALSYGHTFAVYGRVGTKIGAGSYVAGLHPFTDSSVPWMIGHLIPVPSETGASDGDTEDKYIIARYRVLLTEPEYKKLVEGIKKLQASSPVWHAVLYNCNAFVGDIAKSIGLQIPSTMNMPKEFINDMKALNAPGAAVQAASTASSVH